MSVLSQIANRRLVKSRFFLSSVLLAFTLLTVIAYVDAYVCVFILKEDPYPFATIRYWWFSLTLIMIVTTFTIAVTMFINRPTWRSSDSQGVAMIIFVAITVVISGLFDLVSATFICSLKREPPFNWLSWSEWSWIDTLPIPRIIATLQTHAHVMLNDLLISSAIGAATLFTIWTLYLRGR